jgi:hypothetical protein
VQAGLKPVNTYAGAIIQAPFLTVVTSTTLVGLTTTKDGLSTAPIRASRLTLTAAGSVTLRQIQQGN